MTSQEKEELQRTFKEFLDNVPEDLKSSIPDLPLEIEIFDTETLSIDEKQSKYLQSNINKIRSDNYLHLYLSVADLPANTKLNVEIKVFNAAGDKLVTWNLTGIDVYTAHTHFNTGRTVTNESYLFTAILKDINGNTTLATEPFLALMDINHVNYNPVLGKTRIIDFDIAAENIISCNMMPPTVI